MSAFIEDVVTCSGCQRPMSEHDRDDIGAGLVRIFCPGKPDEPWYRIRNNAVQP